MRQAQKKKDKDKVAVVLMLCFCVIALTSIFTVKANIDKIKDNTQDIPVAEETPSKAEQNPSNPKESTPDEEVSSVSSNIPTVDSSTNNDSNSQFVYPVKSPNATLSTPYSMDALVYSVTLDQYMTHCGVDICAPEDTQVVAIGEGTVTAVYQDDRYGTSIEVTHPDKLISIYSNLSTSEMVEIGDVVTKGQIIGGVGSTALFESSEPAHLHFEMIKNGSYVNPAEYISF